MTQKETKDLIERYDKAHADNYALFQKIAGLVDSKDNNTILAYVCEGFTISMVTKHNNLKYVRYNYVRCNGNTCATFLCSDTDDHILKIVSLDTKGYYNAQESTSLWPTWVVGSYNLERACIYLAHLLTKLNELYTLRIRALKNNVKVNAKLTTASIRIENLKTALLFNRDLLSNMNSSDAMPKQWDIAMVTSADDVKGKDLYRRVRYVTREKYCHSPTHATGTIFMAIGEDKWTWCGRFFKTNTLTSDWPKIEVDVVDDRYYDNIWLLFWRQTLHKLIQIQQKEYQELTGGLPPIDSLNNTQDGKSNNSGTTAKISDKTTEIISRQIGRGTVVSVRAIGITIEERHLNNETSSIES